MTVAPLDPTLLRNFAIALFLGAMMGVDRERKVAGGEGGFGGLRTFTLVSLAGGTASWLGGVLQSAWLVPIGLVGLCLLLAPSAWRSAADRSGLTSEVAAIIAYLLGAACTAGAPEIAVAVGISATALLAFKTPLHALASAVDHDDLAAGLKLLFATFVVLPLLPNEPLDPLGVLNPARLWWLVVLISALSLLGYVAVRTLGERRGTVLTGLFGGLVSSTAVTLSSARQSLAAAANPDVLAMGILTAWTVMFVRVIAEVAVVEVSLLPWVGPPMAAMAVGAAITAVGFGLRPHPESAQTPMTLQNPFSLREAAKFGALFGAVLLVVALARKYADDRALYAVAALAGTTDVDAITLSMAEAAGGTLDPRVAARAIAIAAASNTVVKATMVVATGSRGLRVRIGGAAAGLALVGGLAAILT